MANAVSITARSAGIVNTISGTITSSGSAAAATISLGFVPRKVKVIDITGVIIWEKLADMAASNTIKTVTAGTTTVDTGSAIVINSDGTITLSSTLCGTGKTIVWTAEA